MIDMLITSCKVYSSTLRLLATGSSTDGYIYIYIYIYISFQAVYHRVVSGLVDSLQIATFSKKLQYDMSRHPRSDTCDIATMILAHDECPSE